MKFLQLLNNAARAIVAFTILILGMAASAAVGVPLYVGGVYLLGRAVYEILTLFNWCSESDRIFFGLFASVCFGLGGVGVLMQLLVSLILGTKRVRALGARIEQSGFYRWIHGIPAPAKPTGPTGPWTGHYRMGWLELKPRIPMIH